jgi:hypothetical protein
MEELYRSHILDAKGLQTIFNEEGFDLSNEIRESNRKILSKKVYEYIHQVRIHKALTEARSANEHPAEIAKTVLQMASGNIIEDSNEISLIGEIGNVGQEYFPDDMVEPLPIKNLKEIPEMNGRLQISNSDFIKLQGMIPSFSSNTTSREAKDKITRVFPKLVVRGEMRG